MGTLLNVSVALLDIWDKGDNTAERILLELPVNLLLKSDTTLPVEPIVFLTLDTGVEFFIESAKFDVLLNNDLDLFDILSGIVLLPVIKFFKLSIYRIVILNYLYIYISCLKNVHQNINIKFWYASKIKKG